MTDKFIDGLSFDDVLIIPSKSSVLPKEVNIETSVGPLKLNAPLISAAMDTVTESKAAIAMAQQGGIGVIHKNLNPATQAEEVKRVKKFQSGVVSEPISVKQTDTLAKVLELKEKYAVSGFPVIEGTKLVGIITHRDIQFETDRQKSVAKMMTPKEKLITAPANTTLEEAKQILHRHRIEKLPLVNDSFDLKGLITVRDIETEENYPMATRDSKGRLCVAAAIGVGPAERERAIALIEAQVDMLVIDTAHGHSKGVIEMTEHLKHSFPEVTLVAGNIATEAAAHDLIKAGADILKVGVGPGSICTTRIVSGCGMPQFSAIREVAAAAHKKNVSVIADGGIKFSGDITKALAAGANAVMIGSLFAGTDKAPGEVVIYKGRSYKLYRGMGSITAMQEGSRDRYGQQGVEASKLVPEGIEGRVPYRGRLEDMMHQLLGGLRAGMGYAGCATLAELREKARFVKITAAGYSESHVHDVDIVTEAPNYWALNTK